MPPPFIGAIVQILLLLIMASELVSKHSLTLQGVDSATTPEIKVDRQGSFYYRDFDKSAVYKLDKNGKLLFRFGRDGHGPGELDGPFRLCLLQNFTKLLVVSINGEASLFNTSDGKFVKSFHVSMCNQIARMDENSFISVGGAPGGKYFFNIDLNGKKQKSWWSTPGIDLSKPFTRHYATVYHGGKLYYAEGTYPEVTVIKGQSDQSVQWTLVQPKYYLAPPDQPISKAVRFDREKVQKYYNSFTHLDNLCILEGDLLAVSWALHIPSKGSIDIYSLAQRKPIVSNAPMPGPLADSYGKILYVLEEDETEEGLIIHKIHSYELTEK